MEQESRPVQREPDTEKRGYVEILAPALPARSLVTWQHVGHPPHTVPLRSFALSPVVAEKAQRWSVTFPGGFPAITSAGN